jgi:peroxiredoxin 2/4
MPLVQSQAPDFTAEAVVDREFKTIRLSDFRGRWVYLFFYPSDFTFVCPTEVVALSDAVDTFDRLGTQILGCSVDSKYVHLRWIDTPREDGGLGGLRYPLISDLKKEMATAYDVLAADGRALRGSFIIDPRGTVRQATINDTAIGRSVPEALRLIEALQYADAHPGEVCPADWVIGQETIREDPYRSREYFSRRG